MRELAAAAPPAPPRDLAAEQAELRDLRKLLPWLQLRKPAEELGISRTTFNAYFADEASDNYRPLRDANHADMLWTLLRDMAHYIQVSLPEAFQKPVPPLPQ